MGWCTCGVCLSASVLSAREGVREGSLRVLQLGRCGADGIEGTARILRPCFLCARGGGLHVVSCCSVRGMALSILALLMLTDFERFQVKVNKQKRNRIIRAELR